MQPPAVFTAQVLQILDQSERTESEADSNPWGSGAVSCQDLHHEAQLKRFVSEPPATLKEVSGIGERDGFVCLGFK